MSVIKKLLANGYLPLIPVILWNVAFYSGLPPAFAPQSFNANIPLPVLIGENVFRSIIFVLPLLMRIDIKKKAGRNGLTVYLLGVALYFLSWLALMFFPNSSWSTSALGFSAPAYTPIVWLVGMALMAEGYYFRIQYSRWHFMIPSAAFIFFHVWHTALVYLRN